MKNIAILGSTGSIGLNTLDIIRTFPEEFRVSALTAGNNIELLLAQIETFRPRQVAVLAEADAVELARRLPSDSALEIHCGEEGLVRCATAEETDMVVAAVVGAAGLIPTLAAIRAGKHIALANKEVLVTAGPLIMAEARLRQVDLLPVDSEHSAIFQALAGQRRADLRRLILTASGGPFREYSAEGFEAITPEDALAHPNWDMGRKISIDSATMMNKGLEVIEARWLFDVPAEQIAVHIHPESIVHSMVEYRDGSVMAQLGIPDMKTPIAYALSWPRRLPLSQPPLDLCALGQLTFSQPDSARFPCLNLAYQALAMDGTAPAVLNAANEIAVAAFLDRQLDFTGIPRVIEAVLQHLDHAELETIDQVLEADRWGRQQARELICGGNL